MEAKTEAKAETKTETRISTIQSCTAVFDYHAGLLGVVTHGSEEVILHKPRDEIERPGHDFELSSITP